MTDSDDGIMPGKYIAESYYGDVLQQKVMAHISQQLYYGRYIRADVVRQIYYGRCTMAESSRQIYHGIYRYIYIYILWQIDSGRYISLQ